MLSQSQKPKMVPADWHSQVAPKTVFTNLLMKESLTSDCN